MLPIGPVFYDNDPNKTSLRKLTRQRVEKLENTSELLISEKINLLALLLGYKWTTDVAIDIDNKDPARKVLDELELPYANNHYTHQSETHTWLQVGANHAILDYVISRRNELSVIEAGMLYGYPVSHSLGYVGLLDKQMKGSDKTIAEFYLSGVFSAEYSERESKYFEEVWSKIAQTSSKIADEAKRHYLIANGI